MIRCVIALSSLFGIVESYRGHRFFSNCLHATTSASSTTTNGGITERVLSESNQKSDTADWSTLFVNALIKSPLYTPIVALARNTMIKTAASVGVDWKGKALSLREINRDWQSGIESIKAQRRPDYVTPPYYMQPFHGYKEGNLCLDAALEQELAGKAVGVRNFPEKGLAGESFLRECYEKEISALGGCFLPDNAVCVDFGCGTGTSTRRLAKLFPKASRILGVDLSPHMLAIGKFLIEEVSVPVPSSASPSLLSSMSELRSSASTSSRGDGTEGTYGAEKQKQYGAFEWVDRIEEDPRVEFLYSDISHTDLPSGSVGFVNICLVLHELPEAASKEVLSEAFRILQPGGTLAIMEMDPSAPGYIKLQKTPWLYAILKSTEPYLEEYFNMAPKMQNILTDIGFSVVRTSAATGRHLTVVAIKSGVSDVRPSSEVREKSDSHLNTMEKQAPTGKGRKGISK